MNEELTRIKSKDFAAIDEKIFDDLSRAQNLTSTLCHLSDFQKFLMEQISSLNQVQPSSRSNIIAKSIAKNFDDLKQSLVKCSRLQVKPDKILLQSLKKQVTTLKQELQDTKNILKNEFDNINTRNYKDIQGLLGNIIQKYNQQKKSKQQISNRCKFLENQNHSLKIQNQKLKNKADLVTHLNFQQMEILPSISYNQYKFSNPSQNPNFLQKKNSKSILKQQNWKIMRNNIALGFNNDNLQKKNSSLKRQTSNHQISRKTHLNCPFDKQNQTIGLKRKEIIIQELKRGKSKQKIKLFSMI